MSTIHDNMHDYAIFKGLGKCDTCTSQRKISISQLQDDSDIEIVKNKDFRAAIINVLLEVKENMLVMHET